MHNSPFFYKHINLVSLFSRDIYQNFQTDFYGGIVVLGVWCRANFLSSCVTKWVQNASPGMQQKNYFYHILK